MRLNQQGAEKNAENIFVVKTFLRIRVKYYKIVIGTTGSEINARWT